MAIFIGGAVLEDKHWEQIVDLASIIANKIGNPHQQIIITERQVRLVSDDKGAPIGRAIKPRGDTILHDTLMNK